MDSNVVPFYGAGTFVLWRDRLYRVIYTVHGEGQSYQLAIRHAGATQLEHEDEYELTVSARQVRRSPWH
jgi:hypothetical protein